MARGSPHWPIAGEAKMLVNTMFLGIREQFMRTNFYQCCFGWGDIDVAEVQGLLLVVLMKGKKAGGFVVLVDDVNSSDDKRISEFGEPGEVAFADFEVHRVVVVVVDGDDVMLPLDGHHHAGAIQVEWERIVLIKGK